MKLLSSTRWQCLFDFRMFDASNLTVISGSGRFGCLVVVVFLREQKKERSKLSRILERFPVSGFQESLTVTHRGKMHWHTHMQVTLGVKVQSNCFQFFFFCLFSPLEVGDASWYQPVLPHKRTTPAGIKPRSSALCCPAAGLICSDAAFNSSQGSLTNNPFFFFSFLMMEVG